MRRIYLFIVGLLLYLGMFCELVARHFHCERSRLGLRSRPPPVRWPNRSIAARWPTDTRGRRCVVSNHRSIYPTFNSRASVAKECMSGRGVAAMIPRHSLRSKLRSLDSDTASHPLPTSAPDLERDASQNAPGVSQDDADSQKPALRTGTLYNTIDPKKKQMEQWK